MRTVDIEGIELAYREDGPEDGPPLVLINSLGTDHRVWERQLPAFGAEHRVIRYDARGQGESASPAPPYTLAQLGSDVVGLLDHLGVDRAHVCGVSLGGIVALWVAIHHPDRSLTATFANTAARIGSVEGWDERISAVRRGGMAGIRDLVLQRFFSDAFRAADPAAVAEIGASIEQHDTDGYIGACTALRDADLRDEVGDITVPALVVTATADVSTPPAEGRWLHQRLPTSTHVELDGAGHLSNIERPREFSRAVLDHLETFGR